MKYVFLKVMVDFGLGKMKNYKAKLRKLKKNTTAQFMQLLTNLQSLENYMCNFIHCNNNSSFWIWQYSNISNGVCK